MTSWHSLSKKKKQCPRAFVQESPSRSDRRESVCLQCLPLDDTMTCCVRMHVCLRACTLLISEHVVHVCMYACMHVCMSACMHVCMYACTHVCMYACMHVCMYACTHVRRYACMHVRMYASMHVCMYACMHVCMYACMHAYTHAYACIL